MTLAQLSRSHQSVGRQLVLPFLETKLNNTVGQFRILRTKILRDDISDKFIQDGRLSPTGTATNEATESAPIMLYSTGQ